MRLVFGTMLFTLAAGLAAAPGPQAWVQAKAAWVRPNPCRCIQDLGAYGLGAGAWFTPRWGAELDFLGGPLRSRRTPAEAQERELAGSLLFGLNPDGIRWFPYLRAGLGGARVGAPFSLAAGSTTRLARLGGLGVQGLFAGRFLASGEFRLVTLETRVERTEKQVLLGLGMRWGLR
ncbi:MAG: hypothetical protein P4L36_19000 [Holophaga sp.]|nr:hypothetical protein [Holophaga sp.]